LEVASQHKRHKQFTQDFKKQARELVDFALEDNPNKQVFIFIDELDRCRPTYAIEMLETVKHLFDIPNFIFVLSTDTSQLQHSIKAVYGHDFDSHEYLSRFFEQRLTLPELNYFEFLTAEGIFEKEVFQPLPTLPAINSAEELRAVVALICEQNQYHLSLRRVKQICVQLEMVLDSKELRENAYPILTLIGLVFGNALYGGWPQPELYLNRVKLALRYASNQKMHFNKVEIYRFTPNRGVSNSPVNSEVLINQCQTAINELIKNNPSDHVFGNTQTLTQPVFSKQYLELVHIRPLELLQRRSQLFQDFTRDKLIANEQELLQIVENLNIQLDIVEE
jgi:hypothetical protein